MKKTNHKLVGLALLYLSTTFTFSGNVPVYAGTVENLPIEGSRVFDTSKLYKTL